MPRIFQAIALFVAGAAVAWSISPPGPRVGPVETSSPTSALGADHAVEADLGGDADEATVGVPPASATLPKSPPSAGQKRALARALDRLEQDPPVIEAANLDPETAATLRDQIRARLKGDPK